MLMTRIYWSEKKANWIKCSSFVKSDKLGSKEYLFRWFALNKSIKHGGTGSSVD